MVANFVSAFIIDKQLKQIFVLSSQVQPKTNELWINETNDFTNNWNQRIFQIFAATLDFVSSSGGSYLNAVLIYRWLEYFFIQKIF